MRRNYFEWTKNHIKKRKIKKKKKNAHSLALEGELAMSENLTSLVNWTDLNYVTCSHCNILYNQGFVSFLFDL